MRSRTWRSCWTTRGRPTGSRPRAGRSSRQAGSRRHAARGLGPKLVQLQSAAFRCPYCGSGDPAREHLRADSLSLSPVLRELPPTLRAIQDDLKPPGQIVILNGAPRSGKSSIVTAMQDLFEGVWINLGVDVARATTPARLRPGIGLRPGEPSHPAAPYVPILYAALYESVAAHSRLGLNVAVDVGHYEKEILDEAAERLEGLPVLFVGVHCPLETIMERRRAAGAERYAIAAEDEPVPPPVAALAARGPRGLDLRPRGRHARLSASECAAAVAERLRGLALQPPSPGWHDEGAMPIDHVKLPVSDLDASRAFYSAALAPLVFHGDRPRR